jgi:BirA family transcriptional regulator, biotin operon repressor / biotin---[acetyl-CoA-carboxylase] ligase
MTGAARLLEWEGRPIPDWRSRWGVPAIVALSETASTNDIARRMSEQGAPAGLLVMTEHQTAGRGRMKRPWADVPGHSLLFSFVLRPAETGGSARVAPGTTPLRTGLAIAAALRDAAGVDARLKWPNDVVTEGRKVAGILCEAATGAAGTVIIAGVGINVLQQPDDWPEELRAHAISVTQAGATPDGLRPSVMDAVVAAMRPLFTRPLTPLDNQELQAYSAIDALRGLEVAVSGASPLQGIASGIAADGALLIETAGTFHRVTSGTVRVNSPLSTTAWKPQ